LKSQLRDPLRPGGLDRIWRAIDGEAPRSHALRGRALVLSAAASTMLVAGLVWFGFLERGSDPLLLNSGDEFSWMDVPGAGTAQQLRFEDGSTIALQPGATLSSVASTSENMVLSLQRGSARFSIVPSGVRRWTIETAHGRVQVLGTEFAVDALPGGLRVEVVRGLVRVSSPWLTNGLRELAAGERVELTSAATGTQAEVPLTPPLSDAESQSTAAQRIGEPPTDASPRVTREVATAPDVSSPTRARSAVAELMSQADEARAERRFARASELLQQVVRDYPKDGRASLAAFTRGVLQLQRLGQGKAASGSFQQALSLGASASLREDCYLRWFEAELQLGRREAAIEVFDRYRKAFARGRHLSEISRQLEVTEAK
jgi:transmembrane sensor